MTDRPRHRRREAPIASWGDRALDAVVVLLATWTLVYHVALLIGLASGVALVVEVLLLVGVVVVRSRRPGSPREPEPDPLAASAITGGASRGPLMVSVGAAALAAAAMASDLPWVLVWVPWLVAAVAGTVAARSRLRDPVPSPDVRSYDGPVALAWAIGLAVFSTFPLRPNPDDLYYVNLSQWVAEHGTFPLRDTLFSDLAYPMSSFPPMASYDGLTGAFAHLIGVPAGDVVYVVVPPVATFLSVLALWRLLRAWRVRLVAVALSAALVFLLLDGTSAYGPPGNLFVTRLWQGKVILLCVLVPVLLTYAVRYAERPTRAGLVRLGLAGVAGVGLSTTAIFLVPVIAVAGAVPLLARSRRHAAGAFAATAAYPLLAGIVTKAVGGRSADDFADRRLYRFEPDWFGHIVFLTGLLALVAVLAVLLGPLLVPHPSARVTTGVLVLAVGVTFVPGLTRLTYATIELGPTLWRITWGLSVAALVGVAAAAILGPLRPRPRVAVSVVAVVALGAGGSPVWKPDTSTRLVAPLHWQRGEETRSVVTWMRRHTRPGDVVLAPDPLAITVAVSTTEIKTVAPRDYFMSYLRDDPSFRYDQRLTLVHLVNDVGTVSPADVGPALSDLRVAVACTYRTDATATDPIEAAGYVVALRTGAYTCLSRLRG